MKKVSYLFFVIISIITISVATSCSKINVDTDGKLYIQLPGGNFSKAISPDSILWFDVIVENEINTYSGGDIAGSTVYIDKVLPGRYKITCNGKINKDDLFSFYTDSKVVDVTAGENTVNLLLDNKYNGCGIIQWEKSSIYDTTFYPKLYDFTLNYFTPFGSTEVKSFVFDDKGDAYFLCKTDPMGYYQIFNLENGILSNEPLGSIRFPDDHSFCIDYVSNTFYYITKNQMLYSLAYIQPDFSSSKDIANIYFPNMDADAAKEAIYDSHLYMIKSTDLMIYDFSQIDYTQPDFSSEYITDSVKQTINLKSLSPKIKNISDIIAKDGYLYILANNKEGISVCKTNRMGVLFKFRINNNGTVTYVSKLGDSVKYLTDDIPYFYSTEGNNHSYLYKKVGENYVPFTRRPPANDGIADSINDSTYFHCPLKIVASTPDYLVIADSSDVFTKSGTSYLREKKDRLAFINLKNFEIQKFTTTSEGFDKIEFNSSIKSIIKISEDPIPSDYQQYKDAGGEPLYYLLNGIYQEPEESAMSQLDCGVFSQN